MNLITAVYNLLWGDLIFIPLPGGGRLFAYPLAIVEETALAVQFGMLDNR